MRYLKYIKPALSLLTFTLFFVYLFQVEQPTTESVIVLIGADLLIKISFKIYSTRLLSSGETILIRQKESNWMNFLSALSLVVILFLTIYAFTGLESSIENKIGIILPLYIGLSSFLFSNKRGDFYIDQLGFIQPELLKKNYRWSEIENFSITDDSIEFKLDKEAYKIQITEKEKSQLINLKINKATSKV